MMWRCMFCGWGHRNATQNATACPKCDKPRFCQSRTRRAVESGAWSATRETCSNRAKHETPDGYFCGTHLDPKKRY